MKNLSADIDKYLNAYSFIEFSSGKTLLNISRTVEIMRLVYDNVYNKYNISEPKFLVILLLSEKEDGIPLIEIGRKMLVSRANITTLIKRMEKEGIVERRNNKKDKRSIKAHLTDKGRGIFDEVKYLYMDFSEKMVSCLSDEEKNLLNNLLVKIQTNIVNEYTTEYQSVKDIENVIQENKQIFKKKK
ncbi:MarR family winged helix-turn-helix transcriptional regulator [Helicovermis profundi]|uniref:HTH marR-type domain-containing protein n=1 Tax=Helicovermis profundi TaxID=3065157 RepID=A0AAU9EYW7_9FIRM|nr:hypothetical protein HLPR_26210 [Clostridia bacterium S502]